MSKFKTADARQRERATADRTQRGLTYLNPEFQFQTYTPNEGDNSIRIVPPLGDDPDASLWGLDIWVYYIGKRAYLSPSTFDKNARDPVMERYNKIKQEDAEAAKAFKPTKRSLTFILDTASGDNELKIWAAPTTVIDEIIKVSKNRRTGELIPVEDPVDGRVVFYNKTGQGINTKYSAFQLDNEKFPLDEDIADQLVHFRDLLIVPTADELDKVLKDFDSGDSSSDGDNGGERPAPRTRRPAEVEDHTNASEAGEETAAEEEVRPTASARQRPPSDAEPAAQAPAATNSTAAAAATGGDDLKARVQARMAARQNAKNG